DGVYFVPAFAGLGTPHWDPDARGLLIGLTRGTTRAHLCRAALESIAYQSLDLCEAFGSGVKSLSLGGEIRANESPEVTALGAAMIAGLGCGLIKSQQDLMKLDLSLRVFKPAMK